jgi:hypothetical protein
MSEKPRDVLGYTGKLPRYNGAADAAALLLPAWVRSGNAAFAISINQLAALVSAAPSAPAPAPPATNLSYDLPSRTVTSSTGTDATIPLMSPFAAGLVPTSPGGTTLFLRADGEWGAAGGGAGGTATVTVPQSRFEHEQVITATGVTPSSRVTISLGTMLDSAENAADMLDIASMGAVPGTNQITVQMAFRTRTSGPIPLNWSAD